MLRARCCKISAGFVRDFAQRAEGTEDERVQYAANLVICARCDPPCEVARSAERLSSVAFDFFSVPWDLRSCSLLEHPKLKQSSSLPPSEGFVVLGNPGFRGLLLHETRCDVKLPGVLLPVFNDIRPSEGTPRRKGKCSKEKAEQSH